MFKKYTFALLLFLTSQLTQSQTIEFEDANFKQYLLDLEDQVLGSSYALNLAGIQTVIDVDDNGSITVQEVQNISELSMAGINFNINSLADLQYFTNLRKVRIMDQNIQEINFSPNALLEEVELATCPLTTVDVTVLPLLKKLSINQIQLTALAISNPLLTDIYLFNTSLTTIDFSNTPELYTVNITDNTLVEIDLNDTKAINITCSGPNLERIFMKNGSTGSNLSLFETPNIKFVCIDPTDLTAFTINFLQTQYSQLNINTYCSFVPGGTYYEAIITNKLDTDSNGCNAADANIGPLRFEVFSPNGSGIFTNNLNVPLTIPLQAGSYTIFPRLENPSYFTVTPSLVSVDFPEDQSPLENQFCLVPNGVKSDVEVVVTRLPRLIPMAGFDVKYKLVYKNKGNQIENGTVKLNFLGDVMDIISTTVEPTTETANQLTWNYTNLRPQESRAIVINFLLNSPQSAVPLDSDDILDFGGLVEGTIPGTDQTPDDNSFFLSEKVVNSMDPNDITCNEGEIVGAELIGQYVHYTIRFENIGTANARNVVIKNLLDTSIFDISTLIPLYSNFNFVTRSTNNLFEFIYENIDLPFDDANNDGILIYKIKLKNNLVVGNTFTNQAEIYFDFNFPIITNIASTQILTLGVTENELADIQIYPNPASQFLKLTQVPSSKFLLRIFDLAGKKIQTLENQESVDVSGLSNGLYLLKIESEGGTRTLKFAKTN
ncbi:T9SS type A sorting domain-containing protein [Flavobacterium sp.]|uniref:T9SS type A sorting domain-containing protein n=1 Tax=Flavobacterium sp. TaxID=239 RepID=UPI00262A4BC6|nr:T9SS type A sorting domain-containing protein [Flavobacterium sp.]